MGFPLEWTGLKGLGNAVVPQVVELIGRSIEAAMLECQHENLPPEVSEHQPSTSPLYRPHAAAHPP